MIDKIPSLQRLCRALQHVPYLASKNLYKVVSYFLTVQDQKVEALCQALRDARNNIIQCHVCCVWQERGTACIFCNDAKRDHSLICVVETWQELIAIEKTEGYKGMYHVLGGAISPLDGIGSEDLSIGVLVARVVADERVQEVIFATNQTPEGEATAAFIAKKIIKENLKISCLARGIPVGSCLEMMDKLTVYKALSERRLF